MPTTTINTTREEAVSLSRFDDLFDEKLEREIERLGLTDWANKIFLSETIQDLFENDGQLTSAHLERVRRLAKLKNVERPNSFNVNEFINYCKKGLLFIELFYARILDSNRDIEPRPSQVLGSKLMYLSHFFKASFIGEYPTGSGKSFMYLIFAAALYFTNGERTIVATAGINLQEQIDNKDAPYISGIYRDLVGKNLPYLLIKGRQNYACNKKLKKLFEMLDGGVAFAVQDEESFKRYLKNIPRHGFNGDLSNIDEYLTYELKEALTVRDARMGGCNNCEMKGECYFYTKTSTSNRSAIVIINYHVLLTEIEKIKSPGYLSGGLPTAYIFDEAHELASISRDFSEIVVSGEKMKWLISKLSHIEGIAVDSAHPKISKLTFSNVGGLRPKTKLEELNQIFRLEAPKWYETLSAFASSRFSSDVIIPAEYAMKVEGLLEGLSEVNDMLTTICEIIAQDYLNFPSVEALYAAAEESDGSYDTELHVVSMIEDTMTTIGEYIATVRCFSRPALRREDTVYWLSNEVDGRESKVSFKIKMVDTHIVEKLIKRATTRPSMTSVSATLAVDDSFAFYRTAMDIPPELISFEVVGESPFKLKEQEMWYLPKEAQSAKGADESFDALVSSQIIELLTLSKGGALVLFTTRKSMDSCYNIVSKAMPELNILKQNSTSKKILLERFTNDINSVLFANRSFFTGVDVKGPSLRLIILDKLPFDNPTDPVNRTLSERPYGFQRFAIPSMVTILKQIVGRGVRSTTDKCVIAFMDSRLKTAGYASTIRQSFSVGGNAPRKTEKIEDVALFFGKIFEEHKDLIFTDEPEEEDDWLDLGAPKVMGGFIDFTAHLKDKK